MPMFIAVLFIIAKMGVNLVAQQKKGQKMRCLSMHNGMLFRHKNDSICSKMNGTEGHYVK